MPLYDYLCRGCGKRFEVYLSYREFARRRVACPHCRGKDVQRRIPRVRMGRSEESRIENFADPSSLAGLEEDPKSLGRMMRKMGNELGEEIPPEFDEVVDRLEKGQSPDEIEKALPDLGAPGEAGGEDSD